MEIRKYDSIPRLEDYNASPTFGFVEEKPSTELPEYFKPWADLAKNTKLLIDGGQLRDRVHKLPLLDHQRLGELHEWQTAHVYLSALTQAYVWCQGEEGIPEVLPRCLAVPFAATAEKLQVPPSLTNYGFGITNWRRKDPDGKVELDNMETYIQIYGGSDESWFFCVVTQAELDFAPALCSILEAQRAVIERNVDRLIDELQIIGACVCKMKETACRITEQCRPDVFYNIFRPFLAGWDASAFKRKNLKGLIYEGVSEEPLCCTGGSAAQSSTIPCLDAALGVEHDQSAEESCQVFRQYMPKPHRELIEAIARGPSIKTFVHECGSTKAVPYFNQCLLALKALRDSHLQIVTRYIVAQAKKADAKKQTAVAPSVGTGGTGFMVFLKGLRNATIRAMVGTDINGNRTSASDTDMIANREGALRYKFQGNMLQFFLPLAVCISAVVFTLFFI